MTYLYPSKNGNKYAKESHIHIYIIYIIIGSFSFLAMEEFLKTINLEDLSETFKGIHYFSNWNNL